ncbi:MAG TPA: YfhO family protein [Polyangiaceae bacterium]|nr:YfhO family protein [Polyangiaceae bacterium]
MSEPSDRPSLTRDPRWAGSLGAAFVGAVPFVAFWRLWVPGPRAQYLFGDTAGLYWPDLVYLRNALAHLQLPIWNPFERGGISMLSEPEAGVLYPLNWLLVLLGAPLGMPFEVIEVKACLHLAIGGVALYAWLRRRGMSAGAAAIGGVVYELGPYTAGNAFFALVWPQAWLPVILLASDWILDGGGPLAGLALAAATYLLVVAGSPPTAFYCMLVAAPYFCLRAARAAQRDGAGVVLARSVRPLLLAAVLAALASYPLLRGTSEALELSRRAARNFGYVAEMPLPSSDWLGFVFRDGSHIFVYLGVPVLTLAAIGLLRWRDRAEARLFGALAISGFLLMLGGDTPLLQFLFDHAPPFRLFRICSRYVFLVQAGAAVLAARGFEALAELKDPGRKRAWVGKLAAPIAVMLVLVVMAWPRLQAPIMHEELRSLVLGGVVTLAFVLGATLRPRAASALAGIMAFVLAVDLGDATQRAGVLKPGHFDARSSTVSGEWLRRMRTDAEDHRVFDEFGFGNDAGDRLELRDLRGYLEPLALQRVLDVYDQIGKVPQILGLYNVRWLMHGPFPGLGLTHNFIKSADKLGGFTHRDGSVYEVDERAAAGYWVQGARVTPTVKSAIASLGSLDRKGELVLAEEDVGTVPPERHLDHAPREDGFLEKRSYSWLRFTVDAPSPGYFVVNESWFPGWRATVDGQATPILKANAIMQAVQVSAGHHVIELRFRPWNLLGPLLLAVLAWLGAIGWVVRPHVRAGWDAWRARRARPSNRPTA